LQLHAHSVWRGFQQNVPEQPSGVIAVLAVFVL